MGSPFEYDDTTPQGWDPGVYRNQAGQGWGVTSKFGPKPPSPDDVAKRGTPAWRAALARMDDWVGKQLFTGATLGDMGFSPEHERGKQRFVRLSKGEFGGFRGDWFNAAKGFGRSYIDPYTGQVRQMGGGGGGSAPSMTAPRPAPTTGMIPGGSAAPVTSPSAMPFAPPAPTVAPSSSFASPSMPGGVSASDAYAQFPRGGKKKAMFQFRG